VLTWIQIVFDKIILLTDLDGTLLSHENFDFSPIKHKILALLGRGIVIIPASSKTQAEITLFCSELGRSLPFIYENGAGFANAHLLGSDTIVPTYGVPVSQLKDRWETQISHKLQKYCIFLSSMTEKEQMEYLGLEGKNLFCALARQFSLPFVFDGPEKTISELKHEASLAGLTVQSGGRILNLSGLHNKASYLNFIRRTVAKKVQISKIVSFGDSENDMEMLIGSDVACIIPRPNQKHLHIDNSKNKVIKTTRVAPLGWIDAASEAIKFLESELV